MASAGSSVSRSGSAARAAAARDGSRAPAPGSSAAAEMSVPSTVLRECAPASARRMSSVATSSPGGAARAPQVQRRGTRSRTIGVEHVRTNASSCTSSRKRSVLWTAIAAISSASSAAPARGLQVRAGNSLLAAAAELRGQQLAQPRALLRAQRRCRCAPPRRRQTGDEPVSTAAGQRLTSKSARASPRASRSSAAAISSPWTTWSTAFLAMAAAGHAEDHARLLALRQRHAAGVLDRQHAPRRRRCPCR